MSEALPALVDEGKIRSSKIPNSVFYLSMVVIAAIILFLIVIIKSKTITGYKTDSILIVYTVFITTFEISRIMTASLYRSSMTKVANFAEQKIIDSNEHYEPTVTFVIPCMNEG